MYLRFLLTALRAFRTLLLIVIVLIIPALNAQSANSTSSNGDCKFTKLRREIRDLSQADIDRLIKALSIMRTTASPTMPGMSKWEAFIQWHSMNQREVHVDPKFFVFHRAFVNLFENELRRIDPDIEGLPYWNLAVDALSPENNTMWELFGSSPGLGRALPPPPSVKMSNTTANSTVHPRQGHTTATKTTTVSNTSSDDEVLHEGGCLINGPFSTWAFRRPTRKSSGGSGGSSNSSNSTAFKTSCIMRGFDPKDTSKRWQSLDVVDMTIRESKQYRDFRQQIEFGIHANAHNFIGGTMLYPWSPADSMVFFTLHSYVDKLWADWQDLHDKDRGSNYEGKLDEILPVVDKPAKEFMDIEKLCYEYAKPGRVMKVKMIASTKESDGGNDNDNGMLSSDGRSFPQMSASWLKMYSKIKQVDLDRTRLLMDEISRKVSAGIATGEINVPREFGSHHEYSLNPLANYTPSIQSSNLDSSSENSTIVAVPADVERGMWNLIMQLRDTHDSLVKNDTSGSNSVRVDAKFTDRKGEVLSYPLIVEQSGDTVGVLTTALGNMRDAYLKGAAGAAITVRFQL